MRVGGIEYFILVIVVYSGLIAIVAAALYGIVRLAVKHGLRSYHGGTPRRPDKTP